MKRTLLFSIFLMIMMMAAGLAGLAAAKDPDRKELAPIIKTNPSILNFNCNAVERAKEIAVTNASKKAMTINATANQSWITVEPASQPDIRPLGVTTFRVSVDCRELRGSKIETGLVSVEGMGFGSKVAVRAKSKLGPAARPAK